MHENSVNTHTFVGKRGRVCVAFDGIRLLIECFFGELLIFRGALRDRQLDGTDERSPPLTAFPNSDPACNRLPHPQLQVAELSIYSWHPDHFLPDCNKPGTIGHFVADPDHYIWRDFSARMFFPLFTEAMQRNMAPWQRAMPIPGATRHFVTRAAQLLAGLGYHRVDEVPSWFNVVGFFKKLGYQFTYGEHAAAYERLAETLVGFSTLSVQQQSWLVALQNIPESLITKRLRLDARWPVTHTNQYWARMHLNLNSPPMPHSDDRQLAEAAEKMILDWQAWAASKGILR